MGWTPSRLVIVVGFVWFAARMLLTVITVRGPSMEPSYMDGDRLLVRRHRRWTQTPAVGQVVVFNVSFAPPPYNTKNKLMVKRVSEVIVDELKRPVLIVSRDGQLGADSRDFGPVPVSSLYGVLVAKL